MKVAEFLPAGLLTSMSLLEGVDITLRVGSFLVGAFLAWMKYEEYKMRKREQNKKDESN
jgi:hypothetical protein